MRLLGLILIGAALFLFCYVGIYHCLYKGIVHVIDGFKTNAPTGYVVKWLLVAIFFETIGGLTALVPAVVGWYLAMN
jgi:hypothetical protein